MDIRRVSQVIVAEYPVVTLTIHLILETGATDFDPRTILRVFKVKKYPESEKPSISQGNRIIRPSHPPRTARCGSSRLGPYVKRTAPLLLRIV